jgi:tRNA (guanine26-N2/guanine27-N2)-dimethyltransferase
VIVEDTVKLKLDLAPVIKRDLDEGMPFYNPVMKHNRDMSLAVLMAYWKNQDVSTKRVFLPLAASGVRGVRLLKEFADLTILMNDISPTAVAKMKEHLKLNKCKADISQQSADLFLLCNGAADYIDIDPYGTPNPFLDGAVKKIRNKGILAVTATDTAALCGSSKRASLHKYGVIGDNSQFGHEFGVRSLIKQVQTIGAMYEKGLEPIFAYARHHYYRVFFLSKPGKKQVDEQLVYHKFITPKSNGDFTITSEKKNSSLGPIYTGPLCDLDFVKKVHTICQDRGWNDRWFDLYVDEMSIDGVGYRSIPVIASLYKIGKVAPLEVLESWGCKKTSFYKEGVRIPFSFTKFLKLLQEFDKKNK